MADVRWLSRAETARALGVSNETVRRLVRAGRLPAYRFGIGQHADYHVAEQDLAEFIEKSRVRADAADAGQAEAGQAVCG